MMVEIRLLKYEEIQIFESELRHLILMNLEENYPEYDCGVLTEEFYEKLLKYSEDGRAVVFGAMDQGNLVGFHWAHESVFLEKKRMHSYMNGISPEYRGQHIGSRFFRELEHITRERGLTEIEAFCRKKNPIAVDYHLHNGFEIEKYLVVKEV